MQICLFEDEHAQALRPLVNTRPTYDLRLGMRSIAETARDAFSDIPCTLHARSSVAPVASQEHEVPVNPHLSDEVLFVNGRYVATESPVLDQMRDAMRAGDSARAFVQDGTVVAAWVPDVPDPIAEAVAGGQLLTRAHFEGLPDELVDSATCIGRLWHLLDTLRPALWRDYRHRVGDTPLSTPIDERPDTTVHPSAVAVNPEQIHLAPGAVVQPGAVLNASDGPIYIDEEARVLERAVVRGPTYVGEKSQIKIGANVDGCAIGTWSKIGGEVHDVVVQSLSNKAHDGFLGHAYLGRWCNLGAGTINSNLRNDYGDTSLYNIADGAYEKTGRQFTGLFMGDHSKTAIGTTFNTGTVVGTGCNLFGPGFHPRYIPSFTWGSPQRGYETYRLSKALEVAQTVMGRRDTRLTDADRELLDHVHAMTESERSAFFD